MKAGAPQRANTDARGPGRVGPRNFSPPQRLRWIRGAGTWAGGRSPRLTATTSGSSRPECGWSAQRRCRARRCGREGEKVVGAVGRREAPPPPQTAPQYGRLVPLLGGKAGLPRAPRLLLPASRPRATTGAPTPGPPPPREPPAPRPAPPLVLPVLVVRRVDEFCR